MWKSSIPAFLPMKPVDSVPTNSGCRASPPDHAELEHRRKLCERTTPFAWLLKKDPARSEQGKPILVGPTSVLPSPPPQKASQRRFLLAMTGKRRPVGTTVVLHCHSLREKMTARIKGVHVHSLLRPLAHWGLPELQPAGTPTGLKKGGGGRYELTFVQPPPPFPSLFLPLISSYAFLPSTRPPPRCFCAFFCKL